MFGCLGNNTTCSENRLCSFHISDKVMYDVHAELMFQRFKALFIPNMLKKAE